MTDRSATLSILIVSYNTREMTIACIRSVYEQTRKTSFELIVVDNASDDGSADAIVAQFPDVKLILARENLGFAKANNLAAERARGDYLLLLNPDTVILDGATDLLAQFARDHPAAGIWGGRTVFADGSLNPTSCWRFMTIWSLFAQAVGLASILRNSDLFNRESYGGWKRDSTREVEIVTGCFLLIDRNLWDTLSGFDERFFMYAEDADLCYRARKRGARPILSPDATIVHYGGASESVRSEKIERLYRAKVQLMRKHWSPPKSAVGIGLLGLSSAIRAIAYWISARVLGHKEHEEKLSEWRKVWSRRHEWMTGLLSM